MRTLIFLGLLIILGCSKEIETPCFDSCIQKSAWNKTIEKPYQLIFNNDSVVLISWDDPWVKAGNFYLYYVKNNIITMRDIHSRKVMYSLTILDYSKQELKLKDNNNTWKYSLFWDQETLIIDYRF